MRTLENTQEFKDAKSDVVQRFSLMSEDEWTAWSKRSHGDVLALVQVSQNLRARGSDVRVADHLELPQGVAVNGYLMRAIGFALFALVQLCAEFEVDMRGRLADLASAYEHMHERDAATVNCALCIMAVLFAASTIATYIALCVLSRDAMRRLSFGPVERYGEVLSGVIIAIVGVVFIIRPV